jgi:putative transcriptional regulator
MGRLRSELYNEIAVVRATTGWTQEQLAQAVGVSRQTIIAIEGGTYSPSTVLALRLSILLDKPVNELFALHTDTQLDLLKQRDMLRENVKRQK